MSNPYKTREGGATVTVFVPYDCGNHCPFCINKAEYEDMSQFSLEKICESIRVMDQITPRCDFVFTGGEPLANLPALQTMLDQIPSTHRIFINSTIPILPGHTLDEMVAFLNRNQDKISCVNCSRHLVSYVEECPDEIFGMLECKTRINCVLFGNYQKKKLEQFIQRFRKYQVPIQFRADYTETTLENLYQEDGDRILADLMSLATLERLEGCRIRCNYEFDHDGHHLSYHKTLPYSTLTEQGEDGVTYDILYDILIKQTGEIHSDWVEGRKLDVDRYRNVVFEPYDLKTLR